MNSHVFSGWLRGRQYLKMMFRKDIPITTFGNYIQISNIPPVDTNSSVYLLYMRTDPGY